MESGARFSAEKVSQCPAWVRPAPRRRWPPVRQDKVVVFATRPILLPQRDFGKHRYFGGNVQ
jgi:hypothetical protein